MPDFNIKIVKPTGDFELDNLSHSILSELGKPKQWAVDSLAKEMDYKPNHIRTLLKRLITLEYVSDEGGVENGLISIKSNLVKAEDEISETEAEILTILSRPNRLGAMELAKILSVGVVRRITRRCKKLTELKLLEEHEPLDKRVQAQYSLHGKPLCIGELVCIPLPITNNEGVSTMFHMSGECPFKHECNPEKDRCKLKPYLFKWLAGL